MHCCRPLGDARDRWPRVPRPEPRSRSPGCGRDASSSPGTPQMRGASPRRQVRECCASTRDHWCRPALSRESLPPAQKPACPRPCPSGPKARCRYRPRRTQRLPCDRDSASGRSSASRGLRCQADPPPKSAGRKWLPMIVRDTSGWEYTEPRPVRPSSVKTLTKLVSRPVQTPPRVAEALASRALEMQIDDLDVADSHWS